MRKITIEIKKQRMKITSLIKKFNLWSKKLKTNKKRSKREF